MKIQRHTDDMQCLRPDVLERVRSEWLAPENRRWALSGAGGTRSLDGRSIDAGRLNPCLKILDSACDEVSIASIGNVNERSLRIFCR